jgi:spastin
MKYRIKKVQSNSKDRLLVMGATNRPFDLDNAALRRFPKRIFVDLPDFDGRIAIIEKLLATKSHSLTTRQLALIAILSDGYSGSDLTALAKDASLEPIREQTAHKNIEVVKNLKSSRLRPLTLDDFKKSFQTIRQTTTRESLVLLEEWNKAFGDVKK